MLNKKVKRLALKSVLSAKAAEGKLVVIDTIKLDAIKTDADRAMKIVQFVDLQEVPPVYFEKPYQVMAQPGGEKPLELLRLAMVEEGKAAIGTTVLGNSETPLALIPYGDDLVMMTLHYQSEVRDLPKPAERPAVGEAELDMAKRLVESMAEPFDPARFKNAYQEKLMGLIQDKIAGKQVTPKKPASQPANVINLMDALAASLKARTGEDAGGAKASSSTEGGKAPKPKRKPPAKRAG